MLAAACVVLSAGRAADLTGTITEKSLAVPSGPRGKTMFVPLAPEVTGVRTENRYADPKMWGNLYQEFLFGALGSGVAIGDYDGDGRPDILVASKTESCRLFRNLGDWKFEDVTERAGVGDNGTAAAIWKQGVTFVDVNNDGRLDIYVCRFGAPNLLYINQGDGTFREMGHAYGLDVNDASGMAAFCDYDRDGWLDVYIATNLLDSTAHPNGQRGYLLHNNRDGTFTNVTDRAGIVGESECHSATWWDYDDDGWPDLYVANDYGVPDRLYHNNRDGTFTDVIDQVAPHTSFSSMGSDLGDVNNDGMIDFFVADMAFMSHQMDQRGLAEERGKAGDPPDDSSAAPKYHRNALLLNTGTGRCLEAAYLAGIAATDWTWAVRLEDLDNDGRLDLFVANGMVREENIDVNRRMMNAETTAERVRIMRESPSLPESHFAFRNLGDLQFEDTSAAWGLDEKGISFGAAFGDLDGDGDLDLVYSNYQKGVTVLRNDSDSGHRVIFDLRGTVSNRFGVGAKLRIESRSGIQVRQLTLARGYMSCSEPMVHFGLGDDPLIKRLTVTWPSGHVQVLENLPVDRRFTLTEPAAPVPPSPDETRPAGCQFTEVGRTAGLAFSTHEEVIDETALQRLLPVRLNRRGPALAVGNLPGQDSEDVVVGGTTLDPLRVLHGTPSGIFLADDARFPAVPVDDGPVLLFAATGGGGNDLLVTGGGNKLPAEAPEYNARLYFNDGRGGFTPAPPGALPDLPLSVGAVAAADFRHDGRLGLFIGGRVEPGEYPVSPHSVLLANTGGRFEDVTDSLAPGLGQVGMVTGALWSDVDGDGWPDLLMTLEWGQVKYFHNDAGHGLADWTDRAGFAAAGTGWWTSIASADFNGDGRPDFVVGNVGLNTEYHASPERPALLLVGDFTGRGRQPQLVEAYYENDRVYPWRTRKDLGAAIPPVLKRFPSDNAYARATLDEVLGVDQVAAAQKWAATELRSGVFLSQPDGTYRFEPLPRIAQIAPLQGIVAGDFDGDGHADIYAVQNSYAPIPSVGRFDGGLSQLLLGDGHGSFTPVPPVRSGLVVPGDAKALAVVSLGREGWPGFLASRNNGISLAFRNNGLTGRGSVRIALRGPAGNPAAIGARIIVELTDGMTEMAEVRAGSGYYSQSTAACFFGFPDSNPPMVIRVRWPSGAVTEHPYPANSTRLLFSTPTP
jgi:hypothetical protein